MSEGLRLGNKSSIRVFDINQAKKAPLRNGLSEVREVKGVYDDSNPYDVNLLNNKGMNNENHIIFL